MASIGIHDRDRPAVSNVTVGLVWSVAGGGKPDCKEGGQQKARTLKVDAACGCSV